VKKLVVVGFGAVALSLAAAGPAAADDGVVGHLFSDAKSTLSAQGFNAVVATTVGDRQDGDNCLVGSATRASFKDASGYSTGNNMLVNLNCYSRHSTANSPGYSADSPGRARQSSRRGSVRRAAGRTSASRTG
jgi:hypothetical protein